MESIPKELQGQVKAIQYSRRLEPESKDLKISSLMAVCKECRELLPEGSINHKEMRNIYYSQIEKGYNPKYSNLRVEIAWQIWLELERTPNVYFPVACAEYAREYIVKNGFSNSYMMLQVLRKRNKQLKAVAMANRNHSEIVGVFNIDRIIDGQVDEIRQILEVKQDVRVEADKIVRNEWDRARRFVEKCNEEFHTEKTVKTPLLKEKRNKHVSPSSIRAAVGEMTDRGIMQKDIAFKLSKSERWIRKLQREFEGMARKVKNLRTWLKDVYGTELEKEQLQDLAIDCLIKEIDNDLLRKVQSKLDTVLSIFNILEEGETLEDRLKRDLPDIGSVNKLKEYQYSLFTEAREIMQQHDKLLEAIA